MTIDKQVAAIAASALLLSVGLATGAGCGSGSGARGAGGAGGAGGSGSGSGGHGGSSGTLATQCEAVCADSDKCFPTMMPSNCQESCPSTVSEVETMGCLGPYRKFLSCATAKPYDCSGPNPCQAQLSAVNACLDRVGSGGAGGRAD